MQTSIFKPLSESSGAAEAFVKAEAEAAGFDVVRILDPAAVPDELGERLDLGRWCAPSSWPP